MCLLRSLSDIGKGVLRIILLLASHLPLVELTHRLLLLHLLRECLVGIVRLLAHRGVGHERIRLLTLHIGEWITTHLVWLLLHLHADVCLEMLGHHVHHLVLLLLLLHHHHLLRYLILFMTHWVGNESRFLLLSTGLLLLNLSWNIHVVHKWILHHSWLLLLLIGS